MKNISCFLFLLILACVSIQVDAQDRAFEEQLAASRNLKEIMKPDSSSMGFTRWAKKKVELSRALPLEEDFEALRLKGPGVLKAVKDVSVSGEGSSLLLDAPSALGKKNPTNRSYAFAEVVRPLDKENLEGYNRISAWVKLDAPGFYSAFVGVTVYNSGENPMPTPGRFEGQHYLTIYPDKWQRIIWEIPDIYRDRVEGISISIMAGGSPMGASDRLKLYIDELKIEKVDAENTRGFKLRKDAMAYSHIGYGITARKQALVQDIVEKRFALLDMDGEEVYTAAPQSAEKGFSLLDFSDFKKEGRYRLKVGDLQSEPFPIGAEGYLSTAWRTLNFFFAERCGFDQAGIHQVCHRDVFCVHPDGRRIPVNGGWHDAADLTQGIGNTARGIVAMLELADAVREKSPDLHARILEEARWGINWVLQTRFGDGYRQGGVIVGIWTDNILGTKDDIQSTASNNPFDNFISAIATAKAVPYFLSVDPVFALKCKNAALADFAFARDLMGTVVNEKNEAELYALATVAAAKLFKLTKEEQYLNWASDFADVLSACQELERRANWKLPLHGFFYESREKKRPLAFFHKSNEEWLMKGFTTLLALAPEHPKAGKWEKACLAYADYIRETATQIAPYGILPSAIYELGNADFGGIYHEGEQVGMPSMQEYNAEVKNGIHLGGDFYLRRFPVAYQFRGFHAVLMGKAKATFVLANLLKDKELKAIAMRQFEYIVGYNPFAMSTIYGVGYDYPPLYGAYVGDAVGAVPVGIETFENEDAPYMPMQVNATYKEVWVQTTAMAMGILAEMLSD
ncbi:glycoside hydrolase family 9 protein [Marinilongibacter aquaticus]|uniref:glycoside hydrolase family 9 protein n=1 Tax=Marinilongibacter aquaticus TaxID=2975157 RepID=UPI0021BD4343|nr:glycoside hydrolase family 9 protein [Marinilongibacter aquaticus]UBM58013.1 glycoside hydrolase family 9 protein [Marinilongibacter aquaticus]